VNYYGSSCSNCGGWSTAGAAAAGVAVGVVAGAAIANANSNANAANAYNSGYAAGSYNTAYAMGAIYPTTPAGCVQQYVNGTTYYFTAAPTPGFSHRSARMAFIIASWDLQFDSNEVTICLLHRANNSPISNRVTRKMNDLPKQAMPFLTLIAVLIVAGFASTIVSAQQINGVPGSPSSTVTLDGKQLPPPPLPFGGVIKESYLNSTPYWPPRVVPPKGAPNVLLIMTDDQGYGVSSTFGGVIPTPALDRIAKAGLRYTQFHSTALCSPTRARSYHWAQSSLGGIWCDRRVVHGISRL